MENDERRKAATLASKPRPRDMNIGDTVVITGGTPKYVGLKAMLLDLYRLPSSASKGYYDYSGHLEIMDPPYTGVQVRLIQGSFRSLERVTPEIIAERKKAATEQRASAYAKRRAKILGRRKAEAIALANPKAIEELKSLRRRTRETRDSQEGSKLHQQYEDKLAALAPYKFGDDDTAWSTHASLQEMTVYG